MNFKKMFNKMDLLDGKDPDRPMPSSFSEKVRQHIIRRNQEPFLPRLTKILFISMLILTAAMALTELSAFVQYPQLGWRRFITNLSTTALMIWGVYAAPIILCCCLGIFFSHSNYWKRQRQMGNAEKTPEALALGRRALRRLNRPYYIYLSVSFAGISFWLLFFLVTSQISL